ncbi:MAG: hypothetical protein ABSC54_02845 [Smithellaceae bacterium]|jgi:hypothetical protein
MRREKIVFFVFVFILLAFTSSGHAIEPYVKLFRSDYQTRLDPAKYPEFKNQTISFYSIGIEDRNLNNFFFYSSDDKIGYELYYSHNKPMQPVSSFFWYALEKTFGTLGLVVTPDGPIENVPALVLTFTFLNDQEAKFRITLTRNEKLLLEKTISVTQKLPPTNDIEELEKRGYALIDLIARAILNDPDFKRGFSPTRGKI